MLEVLSNNQNKKNNYIPDESFKRGAELIEFVPVKLDKRQKKQKEIEIENKKTHLLFADDFAQKDFDYFVKYYDYKIKIKCPYCKKSVTDRGFTRHLKNHNVTKENFISEFGGTSLVEMTAYKMFQWYSPNIKKWALQGRPEDEKPYNTFTTEKQREKIKKQNEEIQEGQRKKFIPLFLDIDIIKGHINRNHTLSIYPWGEYAGWMCLDVDTGEEAFYDTEKILDTMVSYGIPRKDILVTFSGNKGYHIEIFFRYPMKYKQIEKFGNKICFLAGERVNKKRWNKKIEVRPEKNKGIKLGLGFNQKTGKKTRVLDENMKYFEHDFQDYIYYLNMNKIDNELIYFILKSTDKPEPEEEEEQEEEMQTNEKNLPTKEYENDIDDEEYIEFKFAPTLNLKIKVVENKFKYGLKTQGTRNLWAFEIAKWMRDILKFDEDKALEELVKWTKRNLEFIKDEKDALRNAGEIVKCVYEHKDRYLFTNSVNARCLRFYFEEIKLIKNIQQQAKQEKRAKTIAPSLLFFTFACLAKFFGSNPFFISKNDLLKYSTLSDKTLYNWLNWLKEKEYIKLIKQGNSIKKQANVYEIPSISINSDNKENSISIDITNENILLDIKKLYNEVINSI